MKKTLLSVMMLLLLPALSFAESKQADSWKARGVIAKYNITKLAGKLEKTVDRESPKMKQLRCEQMLESAYVTHLYTPDLVQKKEEGTSDFREVYHMVLYDDEENNIFDLAYVFSSDGKLKGVNIDLVSDGQIVMPSEYPTALLFNLRNECEFLFFTNDPFKAQVLPNN